MRNIAIALLLTVSLVTSGCAAAVGGLAGSAIGAVANGLSGSPKKDMSTEQNALTNGQYEELMKKREAALGKTQPTASETAKQ